VVYDLAQRPASFTIRRIELGFGEAVDRGGMTAMAGFVTDLAAAALSTDEHGRQEEIVPVTTAPCGGREPGFWDTPLVPEVPEIKEDP